MRTKKILLLSCLLPAFLFFVIGYTNSYTVQKFSRAVSSPTQQPLTSVTFTFVKPTPVTIPANAVVVEKPTVVAKPAIVSDAPSATESTDKVSPESSPSATPTVIPPLAAVKRIAITPVPTIIESLRQQVAKESALILDSGGSSAIIPSASSVIIENSIQIEQMQPSAPQYQPRFCTENDFC